MNVLISVERVERVNMNTTWSNSLTIYFTSLPFCSSVKWPRDSIRAFNDRIKYEEMERCEEST